MATTNDNWNVTGLTNGVTASGSTWTDNSSGGWTSVTFTPNRGAFQPTETSLIPPYVATPAQPMAGVYDFSRDITTFGEEATKTGEALQAFLRVMAKELPPVPRHGRAIRIREDE